MKTFQTVELYPIHCMNRFIFFILFTTVLVTGCRNDHFITDPEYRKKVKIQFEKQAELAKNRSEQLFSVFDQKLTTQEKEAMQFLYAYSSLNDLADYDGAFLLANVRASFAARDTFSWGKTVPEILFRHFVLPIRVNNENLDSSRMVFFLELKDRIRNLTMREAVLEVNHWCHEKVTYRGTDGRTSSPLATVKTAFGRCGEESTLTTAALRSVGIPARQCYTPRWAHCDDNHAWVEVWVDGKWYFIGACEPDVDLNMAWFTKPAKRAMLVNTTVFGDYQGSEEVLVRDPLFTRINLLENYAPVKKVWAKILNTDYQPVDSASVEFQLYNYAEFYPLHKTTTNKDGLCSFTTGLGDLLVWASKNGVAGFSKIDVRIQDTIQVILEHQPDQHFSLDLDFIPPIERPVETEVSDSMRKINTDRLAFEDKLRGAYEANFIDSVKSVRFAALVNLNPDTLWHFLHLSRGNWREITQFITDLNPKYRKMLFPLLSNISEKDLRDITPEVLSDALAVMEQNFVTSINCTDFAPYILNPRVDNEWLRPNRTLFIGVFQDILNSKPEARAELIVSWIKKNITPNTTHNYSRAPITPTGVYELRVADPHSADIFFVAVSRSMGVAARLDPATRAPQYKKGDSWQEVELFTAKENIGKTGTLTLENAPGNAVLPVYTTHYTVQSWNSAVYKTLDFEGSPLVQNYPCTIDVPAGPLLMVTGARLADGTVLSNLTFFRVTPEESGKQSIILRKSLQPRSNYGKINPEILGDLTKKDLIIAWIEPGTEPTKHLLAELKQNKEVFKDWPGKFIFIFSGEKEMKTFDSERKSFPMITSTSFQDTFVVKRTDIKVDGKVPGQQPVVVYLKPDGTISYISEGYRIGIVAGLAEIMNHP